MAYATLLQTGVCMDVVFPYFYKMHADKLFFSDFTMPTGLHWRVCNDVRVIRNASQDLLQGRTRQ